MTTVPKPSWLTSISEDGALAKVMSDERQPFGSRMAYFNDLGFERFSNLITEYCCNGISLSYEGIVEGKITRYLRPDLTKITRPESIHELHIGGSGAFSPDFDFTSFEKFENVKALVLDGLPFVSRIGFSFSKLEVLRVFDWKKNPVKYKENLWSGLRCLQITGFRGDLSTLAGWNIKSLFLDHANLAPFAGLRCFPDLETFKAEGLASDIDLSVLSDLAHLKHLSLRLPRRPPATAGFASRSVEMMILEKVDPLDLDLESFPNLRIYGIHGRRKRLDQWDGFKQYGDPFAAVHYRRP